MSSNHLPDDSVLPLLHQAAWELRHYSDLSIDVSVALVQCMASVAKSVACSHASVVPDGFLTTEEFAAKWNLKPRQICDEYMKKGSFCEVYPTRLLDGGMAWHEASIVEMQKQWGNE
jgi:hypothetical protein